MMDQHEHPDQDVIPSFHPFTVLPHAIVGAVPSYDTVSPNLGQFLERTGPGRGYTKVQAAPLSGLCQIARFA
jgi:hypothetical protein